MKLFSGIAAGCVAVLVTTVFFISGCGSSSATSVTYTTTSNKGDLAVFTIDSGTLTVAWQQKDSVGATRKTLNLTAACAAADSNFGSRRCVVNAGGTCAPGTDVCVDGDVPAAGEVLWATEAPGIGLMVLPANADQLFVGITSGSCDTNVDGDYLYANMGVGQQEIFGIFRLSGGFASVTHADFRMLPPVATAAMEFSTSDVGPQTFTSVSCTNGIRTLTAGSDTLSATLTANGMFVVDKPAGQGGLVAFKVSNAATIADLSGRTLRGFSFPDNSSPSPIKAVIATGSGDSLAVTATQGTVSAASLTAGSSMSTSIVKGSAVTGGGFTFSMTAVPLPGAHAYSESAIQATYATPSAIPGLFVIPPVGGDHGNVLAAVMKTSGNKIVMFGVVFNDRSLGWLPNTGSFIAFEQ